MSPIYTEGPVWYAWGSTGTGVKSVGPEYGGDGRENGGETDRKGYQAGKKLNPRPPAPL